MCIRVYVRACFIDTRDSERISYSRAAAAAAEANEIVLCSIAVDWLLIYTLQRLDAVYSRMYIKKR